MKTCLFVCMLLCCILISPVLAEGQSQDTQLNEDGVDTSDQNVQQKLAEGQVQDTQSSKDGEDDSGQNVQKMLKERNLNTSIMNILVVFLVLSVVFEVALEPIFNWEIFLAYFHNKGYEVPIQVVLAFLVFSAYKLDIVTDLVNILKPVISTEVANEGLPYPPTFGGKAITALLIAGGSKGFLKIFRKLGLQSSSEDRRDRAVEAERSIIKPAGQKAGENELNN